LNPTPLPNTPELSLGEKFEGVLPWGMIDNRPFLRCLSGLGLCLWRLERFEDVQSSRHSGVWLTDPKFRSIVTAERKDSAQQLGAEPEIQVTQRIRKAFVTGGVQTINQ
jgi:hypothetical protein